MAKSAKDQLLLFGGQALRFNGESFRALSMQIRDMNEQSWITETIMSLPACWEALIEEFPQYGVVESGPQLLAELSTWFKTGSMQIDQQESAPALSNIILSPLVVVTHLIEYLKYLDTNSSSLGRSDARAWTGVLGFCTGFLSASAVALSKDSAEIRRYGATAIRLAMLIGGIVDAQGYHDTAGPAKALATAWNTTEAEDQLKNILRRYPESYVSVEYDQNRATVTTASSMVKQLQRELRDVGIIVSEIGLSGRFHHAWYLNHMEPLIQYCSTHSDLCLPDASTLIYPTWCSIQRGIAQNSDVSMLASGPLHAYALKTILANRCRWHQTFSTVVASAPNQSDLQIVLFGPERCIPSSMHKSDVLAMSDAFARRAVQKPECVKGTDTDSGVPMARATDDVAIIGMSIKVAGADDVDDFWDLLCHGPSQHQEVPGDRLSFDNVWRKKDDSATARKWFGNFVNDHDAFDHKFFKKSAREMASTDPQQRLMLQTAYQAVEQSGYFGSSDSQDKNVGCFIGVCSADYENNAACYEPNAFTAIGNLKSFIAGKISHYFGWLGPSLCIDTACSSSLVAVHQACRAVLSGECSAALAGGANIMTNSLWYQNLAAASFLSPTGQCKPFDASADGYCRGEGFAAVLVKKMSRAIADGDQILGTISASVVYQNQNCTPVFVPNSPSLSDLFRDVIKRSEMEPRQITVVEAHGTGTQVGDPAEYQSVKSVLGPATGRPTALALGSVKGLVGHTECVSGAVSLIKTALMVSHKMIPPQVSFNTLNPAIAASPEDGIEIVTRLKPWVVDGGLHAALINNYGASGSNASLVVTTAPNVHMPQGRAETGKLAYPVRFFGADERALRAYSQRLSRYLATSKSWASTTSDTNPARSMANIAFNLSRQTNPNLNMSVVFSSNEVESLTSKLESFAKGGPASDADITLLSTPQKLARPVILCFGGQVSTFVGLDHGVYRSSKIMRAHLRACDDICKSLPGVGTIFPAIHQLTPINDPVKLQTCLFAMQYACAQSWIGCGITPAAVVGHSFGELVALCVSGVLSLHDALEMVSRRATLVRDLWGEDRGAMMAVEGEAEIVDRLLASSGTMASIACFNGPRSFTLAGSSREIDAVAETLTMPSFSSLRFKRLSVTNAFHSALVEPLVPRLVDIGRKLTFNKPRIALELATKARWVEDMDMNANYVARHMREPVYFSHAIERLAQQYPSGCIFLEAGSNSTITKMASRALGPPSNSYFQAVNISGNGDTSRDNLTNATINLWKQGLPVTFWPHHRMQTYEYTPLFLPPYQFEKSRHWLAMKTPPERTRLVEGLAAATTGTPPTGLFTPVEDSKRDRNSPQFRINTQTEKYKELVAGHVIAETAPICPATLIVDIVIEALTSVRPDLSPSQTSWLPQIHQVSNLAPICLDDAMTVMLEFEATGLDHTWGWRITSCALGNTASGRTTLHVTGQLIFMNRDDTKLQAEFKRYERLTGYHQHCAEILDASDADDVIHGARNIYRAFSSVVDYPPPYQGVQRLVGKGNLSAGRVVQKAASDTWLDTHLSDSFSQVAGIWVNCMTDCDPSDMYIAVGFEKWIRSPVTREEGDGKPQTWDVMAHHERASAKAFLSDIFVFDAATGRLQDVILGVNYHKVSKNSMRKTLSRLTTPGRPAAHDTSSATHHSAAEFHPVTSDPDALPVKEKSKATPVEESGDLMNEHADPGSDVAAKIRLILADISGLSPAEISYDTELAEIGIDSLMGMELGREMEGVFKASLMSDALACVITFRELVSHVAQVLGVPAGLGGHGQTSEGSDSVLDTEDTSSEAFSPSSAPTLPDTDLHDIKPLADSSPSSSNHDELCLAPSIVFEAFEETKRLTDKFIADYRCADYMDTVLPKQTQLCVALAVEACEQLGLSLRSARAGESVIRVPHEAQHKSLVDWMYDLLDHEARLIDVSHTSGAITRTAIAAPTKSSNQILAELLRTYPDHEWAHRLTHFAGGRLAEVLRGNQDGIKLIFGTDEGRQLVTGLYGDSLLNNLANAQMRDTLTRLVEKLPKPFFGPLRIMELGAGTGGTTKDMVPMLASLGIPIEYTFTDLSGSFVAAARKKFGPQYPFMKFRVHDIEKPPAAELPLQHVVIASNAIHATRNLRQSVGNIRKALRPDGFLLMLEMTQPLYWVDMIFGLFEGWWLFEDGRRHAIAHQTRWKDDLQAVGYGRVDWTDGWRPEIEIQRILVAQASAQAGFALQPREMKFQPPPKILEETTDSQKRQLDEYVRQYTKEFNMPTSSSRSSFSNPVASGPKPVHVAVTGGTGSLGAHLVAHLAALPQVETIYCLNRRSTTGEPHERQEAAISSRGIEMTPEGKRKLVVLVVDSSKAQLGLEATKYEKLAKNITHIIHNAWPMTGKRPVAGLETQFAAMRNLIDLARDAALHRLAKSPDSRHITFQFISSIAVMGHHSLIEGNSRFAPESRASAEQLLPNGYAQAKWVCERMLDETLHKFLGHFRACVVRPGQIAGSSLSGYWNENEHLSFLVKSSQTLKLLPALEGDMCWTPVDKVAAALAELLLQADAPDGPMAAVYHIDNPVRQPWRGTLSALADELGVPAENIAPFDEWVHRVRRFPGSPEDNPAVKLVDFLDDNFLRMSCGGLLLETRNSCTHSPTMRAVGPIHEDTLRLYIQQWKATGFLHR